jgi:hypothetical protein
MQTILSRVIFNRICPDHTCGSDEFGVKGEINELMQTNIQDPIQIRQGSVMVNIH